MKSKCSDFRLKKIIRIPTTGNGVPENLRGGPWNNFGKYINLMYNNNKLSEDQVNVLACYYWGGNGVQCVKLDPLVTVTLYFTAVDP